MILCYTLANQSESNIMRLIGQKELYELRLDVLMIGSSGMERMLRHTKNLIITFRPHKKNDDDLRKKTLLKAIELGVKYIDIEHDAPYLKELVYAAKESKITKVIISYHNYTATDCIHELRTITQYCKDLGADIIKIATKVSTLEDLRNLMAIYAYIPNVVAMGMGPLGKLSRVISSTFSPPLLYTYRSTKNKIAEGQISEVELSKISKILRSLQ